MNIIRAERSIVKFCDGVEVEGYLLPSGEFRVGIRAASLAVGYGKDWVGQISGKSLKALQQQGFTGSEKIIELDPINGGGTSAKTLSLADFRKIIVFAASKNKPSAIALLNAIVDVGLEDWFRLSFGQQQLTLQEKRDRFYKSYAATIDWQLEDKHDNLILLEAEEFWQFGKSG